MKPIIFLIFVMSAFTASAQKIRFTDSGNQWSSFAFQADSPPFHNAFSYYPDTIVSGITYRHMHRSSGYLYCSGAAGVCPGFSGGGSYDCLIREDTTAGIVYYRTTTTTDTVEHILYNYNLHVGDLLSMHGFTDSVVSMDSIVIDGVFHKLFNMRDTALGFMRSYTVVEGLGCTNSPLFPILFDACFEFGESLVCYSRNDSFPAISAPINSCAVFSTICCSFGGSVFTNSSQCGSGLSVNTAITAALTVSITPVPADKHIEVKVQGQSDNNATFSVYDINGKRMSNSPVNAGTTIINTTSFPDGLYMIIVQTDKSVLKKEKFVIAH